VDRRSRHLHPTTGQHCLDSRRTLLAWRPAASTSISTTRSVLHRYPS